jgi:Ca2+-binding EF-hand superfamily protein
MAGEAQRARNAPWRGAAARDGVPSDAQTETRGGDARCAARDAAVAADGEDGEVMVDVAQLWQRHLASVDWEKDEFRRNEEILELAFHGIPSALRPRVWMAFCGAARHRRRFGAEHYASLVARLERASSPTSEEIAKDISRTLPKLKFSLAALERILNAYALHSPHVGYCQGMNVVCGALLVLFPQQSEEDVFWTFVAIVEQRVSYYAKSMCGCLRDARVVADLVAFHAPELHAHLAKHDLSLVNLCTPWLICLFLEAPLPLEHARRLWDVVFLVGDEALIRAAVALLRMAAPKILQATSQERIMTLFLTRLGRTLDMGELLASLRPLADARAPASPRLASPQLASLRALHQHSVIAEHSVLSVARLKRLQEVTSLPPAAVQRAWEAFLSPDPWGALVRGTIARGCEFHHALAQCVSFGSRAPQVASNAFICGLSDRLFSLFASPHSDAIEFGEFLALVNAFSRSSRAQRLQLCFRFFDTKADNVVDAAELRDALLLIDRMFHGARRQGEAEVALFCDMVWERVGAAAQRELGYETFCLLVALHPLVLSLFQLDEISLGDLARPPPDDAAAAAAQKQRNVALAEEKGRAK